MIRNIFGVAVISNEREPGINRGFARAGRNSERTGERRRTESRIGCGDSRETLAGSIGSLDAEAPSIISI